MSRLYIRLYLAVLGVLLVFAVGAATIWHLNGAPVPPHFIHRPGLAFLFLLASAIAVGAFPVVRSLTRRLERLRQGADALAAGDLTVRVPVEGKDEVAALAASFNHAAGLIEQLVGAHKLLLAQASHELRTPVTRIRLAIDLIPEIDAERRSGLEADIAELDALVEDILLASRLETLSQPEHLESVDLVALVAEECARYDATDLESQPATVRGDPRLLRRLVRNLLENARHHGKPPVHVRIRQAADGVALHVSDAGAPIPEGERERLFTPFHRGGDGKGHGLGLSLVRQIARQHRGDAHYDATEPAGFVVTLPA